MGRRPKGLPKGEPLNSKLTPKQFDLLAGIFVRSLKGGEPGPVVWSLKQILGRSPTRAESASMSARLKVLTERELIKKYGRELFVTQTGLIRLLEDAKEHAKEDDPLARAVLFLVEMLEAKREMDAFVTVAVALEKEDLTPDNKTLTTEILSTAARNATNRCMTAQQKFDQAGEEYRQEWHKHNGH